MQTYTITTKDFASSNTLHAYKITYPTGHWMGNHLKPETVICSHPHRNTKNSDGVEVDPSLDQQVTCERIEIKYPDYLDGAMGEPCLINADKKRVMGALTAMIARGEV